MAHYLTFDDTVTCTVNGVGVDSGYELHDGDVIVASTTITGVYITVNSNWHTDGSTVNVSDSDIVVSTDSAGGSN